MRRLILALAVLLLLVGTRPEAVRAQAQPCGWRARVTVKLEQPNQVDEFSFDDLGVPPLDFTAAAARATYLAREGAWRSTPPVLYPPARIQYIALMDACQG